MTENFDTGGGSTETRRKICFVLTSPFALNAFLLPHIEVLKDRFEITVCLNLDEIAVKPELPIGVPLIALRIKRKISPIADLRALIWLVRFFAKEKFDLVFSITPKAGLLAMMAARLVSVPCRIHCFTGQVWTTAKGFPRYAMKTLDWLLARCATRLLADSHSQRDYLVSERVVEYSKIDVIADGSIAGVDVERFTPNAEARKRIRDTFGIEEDHLCLIYVGRMKREKGVCDLVVAFLRLGSIYAKRLHLLLVGPDDEGLDDSFFGISNLHRVGYTRSPEELLAASDVFCLPSYREGFGLVLIEAGAVGLPVVASRIYGITDAVVEGETGLLHQPGDVADLAAKLEILIKDMSLRRALGDAGRRRAHLAFNAELVTTAMGDFLQRLFDKPSMHAANQP